MKYIFLLVLLSACRKDDQPVIQPTATIEGHWKILVPATPDWHYYFDRGVLIQTAMVGNTQVAVYQFTYAIRHDTLLIGGDISAPPRMWRYTFQLDSLMGITDISPGVAISPLSYLIKT